MIKFTLAACASFVLGILVAPRSGKETRKQIKDYLKEVTK